VFAAGSARRTARANVGRRRRRGGGGGRGKDAAVQSRSSCDGLKVLVPGDQLGHQALDLLLRVVALVGGRFKFSGSGLQSLQDLFVLLEPLPVEDRLDRFAGPELFPTGLRRRVGGPRGVRAVLLPSPAAARPEGEAARWQCTDASETPEQLL